MLRKVYSSSRGRPLLERNRSDCEAGLTAGGHCGHAANGLPQAQRKGLVMFNRDLVVAAVGQVLDKGTWISDKAKSLGRRFGGMDNLRHEILVYAFWMCLAYRAGVLAKFRRAANGGSKDHYKTVAGYLIGDALAGLSRRGPCRLSKRGFGVDADIHWESVEMDSLDEWLDSCGGRPGRKRWKPVLIDDRDYKKHTTAARWAVSQAGLLANEDRPWADSDGERRADRHLAVGETERLMRRVQSDLDAFKDQVGQCRSLAEAEAALEAFRARAAETAAEIESEEDAMQELARMGIPGWDR